MACRGDLNFTSSSTSFTYQSPSVPKKGMIFYTAAVVEAKTWARGGRGGQRGSITIPTITRRTKFTQISKAELSEQEQPSIKRANLYATRKERVSLLTYDAGCWRMYPINEFLSHPSGIEAMLNTRALQSFESLSSNTYRCLLPKIQLLKFEVAPILDLQVTSTGEDCTVEMVSCKFEGSEVVERQNDHFSASMRNHIKWDTNDIEPYLDVNVELNLSLEVYTMPFKMLPISAVENPGNLIMQALVDRLVPVLLQQLLQDYEKWVKEQCEHECTHDLTLTGKAGTGSNL